MDNNLSNDEDYNEFKKKFLDMFLKKRVMKDDEHAGEIAKRQGLIGSGKDNHSKQTKVIHDSSSPGLINHGKDSSNEVEEEQKKKKDEVQSRFNKLYDELRKETADRVDSERNRRERLQLVKQDLVGLLNKLQTTSRDNDNAFAFHGGKFDQVAAEENKKDSKVVDEKEKKESKLAVVELLIRELRQLESNKKQEELKKKEEEKMKESMKRVENIFMEAFREKLSKRKRSEHEEEMRRKKAEEEEQRKKEAEKKRSENTSQDNNARQMLLKLMGELDKRILDEKTKVEEDKKKKEAARHEDDNLRKRSSVEKELDSILSELSNEVTKKDDETSVAFTTTLAKSKREADIDKAFEGFNIANDSKSKARP